MAEQSESIFLRAAWGEDTERAPIWLMRQAGRYMAEYRALKQKHAFWDLVRQPELACEVTMQPVDALGVDAAILFSDIMTPLTAMGIGIEFAPGPVVDQPVRDRAAVERLVVPEAEAIAPYVGEAIGLIRQASPVPLIGFAGAPITLAAYVVEGGGSKDYAHLRRLLRGAPEVADALLDKLTETTIRYLRMQVEAGAQAVQLFDSWAGLYDARTYERFVAPYNRRILEALGDCGVPRIYFAPDACHLTGPIAQLPCEVVGCDWRVPLDVVRPHFGGRALQGNLDPSVLLGSREVIREEALRVLEAGKGGAHIFNLGHGIFQYSDPDDVKFLVELVQGFGRH